MNIFDCALKMEEEARQYYEKLAEASAIPELKQLFTMLAAAEQEHHDALMEIKANSPLKKTGFTALNEAACLFKPLMSKRDLMADLQEDPDAYRHIVQEEEKGIRLYEELAAQSQNEATGKILLAIAAEERKHLNIVENIYSFVESPKNFLAWGEFSNLKDY